MYPGFWNFICFLLLSSYLFLRISDISGLKKPRNDHTHVIFCVCCGGIYVCVYNHQIISIGKCNAKCGMKRKKKKKKEKQGERKRIGWMKEREKKKSEMNGMNETKKYLRRDIRKREKEKKEKRARRNKWKNGMKKDREEEKRKKEWRKKGRR